MPAKPKERRSESYHRLAILESHIRLIAGFRNSLFSYGSKECSIYAQAYSDINSFSIVFQPLKSQA